MTNGEYPCLLATSVSAVQASKLDKLAATGRFGLGFNSVYHFTDLPSFVSGEHLVMFDPHTKYVPGATSVQPGIKVTAYFHLLTRCVACDFANNSGCATVIDAEMSSCAPIEEYLCRKGDNGARYGFATCI